MRVHSPRGFRHLVPERRPHGSPQRRRARLVEGPAPHHEERGTGTCQLRGGRKLGRVRGVSDASLFVWAGGSALTPRTDQSFTTLVM